MERDEINRYIVLCRLFSAELRRVPTRPVMMKKVIPRADLQRELVRIRSFQEIERACRVTGKCGPLTKVSSPKRTACREAVLICCKSSRPMERISALH